MCVACSEINISLVYGLRISENPVSRVSLRDNIFNVACVTCTPNSGVSDANGGKGKTPFPRRAQPPVAECYARG